MCLQQIRHNAVSARHGCAPEGGICGSLSKLICEVPFGSWPYRRRMSGMRLRGTPMPTMSWQLGMLTPLIHSVTGCSTYGVATSS